MLSYLHAFHAGNHADILKHMALIGILEKLNQKGAPYSFFDTHGGSGLYSLNGEKAQKTGEAQKGILSLASFCQNFLGQEGKKEIPLALKKYLDFVGPYLKMDLYPGSPLIERAFLRKDCFHSICELHPGEFERLKENCQRQDKANNFGPKGSFLPEQKEAGSSGGRTKVRTQILKQDGLKNLLSQTPPKIKRGGVLIDPSYEEKSDYEAVQKTVAAVHKKWSAGIIMIWHPLLAYRSAEIESMILAVIDSAKRQNPNTEILRAELLADNPQSHTERSLKDNAAAKDSEGSSPPRLYGSGILVINAPWKLDQELDQALSFFPNNGHSITKI